MAWRTVQCTRIKIHAYFMNRNCKVHMQCDVCLCVAVRLHYNNKQKANIFHAIYRYLNWVLFIPLLLNRIIFISGECFFVVVVCFFPTLFYAVNCNRVNIQMNSMQFCYLTVLVTPACFRTRKIAIERNMLDFGSLDMCRKTVIMLIIGSYTEIATNKGYIQHKRIGKNQSFFCETKI